MLPLCAARSSGSSRWSSPFSRRRRRSATMSSCARAWRSPRVYITLASNLNLMLGYAGYINFGSIVFFGLGGYICVWLVNSYSWPLALSLLAAGIGVSALALHLRARHLAPARPVLCALDHRHRRRRAGFCREFRAVGRLVRHLYLARSVCAARRPGARAVGDLFRLVAVMGLSLYLSYGIKISKFGLGLLAIGQNEDAAAILGVPTPRYKALVYSASAFLPAIAGGLYFFKSAFIQPSDAFDLTLSTEAIVICMLGGQGTVTGVALGAYLYEELRGYLLTSETFSHFQLVISGALLLLIVLFFPERADGFHL